MYREPHLQKKSDECKELYYEWWYWKYDMNDVQKSKIARQQWCQCCDDFGEMISEEVKTNPRYIGHKLP